MAPKNVDDIFSLTPMQRLMLVHALTRPDSVALTNQVVFEIAGPLNPGAFRRAWEVLVSRHAALRTAILWKGLDQPLNVVRSSVELRLVEIDLGNRSEEESRPEVGDLIRSDLAESFDFGRAPLMRGTLVRFDDVRHLFIWSLHHLVVDRWSYGILIEDFQSEYDALTTGGPDHAPAAGRFRDFVDWLNRLDPGESERYWRDHLSGLKRATPWVEAYSRDPSEARAETSRGLTIERTERIATRANLWQTTPSTLLLAAVGTFLARRTVSDDVVFGITVSGRPPELFDVERTVGSFINNVPLRIQLPVEMPIQAWLRSLQVTQVRRQNHEHVSVADLHDWSGLRATEPLFDGLVVLNLQVARAPRTSELEFRPLHASLDAGYAWVLGISDVGSEVHVTLVHDAGFEGASDLLDDLIVALDDLLGADREACVGDLLRGLDLTEVPHVEPVRPERSVDPPRQAGGGVEDEVLAIWRDVLGLSAIGLDDDFFVLGGTSVQAAQIFSRLERVTGRVLPLSTLVQATSVRALLDALDRPVEPARPLVAIRSGGLNAPVVAVPGIGGNVVGLYRLARAMGPDRPFFGLQSRGLDGRDQPLASIEAIAQDFVDEVSPLAADGFHLMGACWGAAVAFEMASALKARGLTVLSLSLLDPAVLTRAEEAVMLNPRRALLAARLEAYWSDFREGDWRSHGRLLKDKARRAADLLLSADAKESLAMELHAQRVRAANTLAVETYRPGPLTVTARVFVSGDWEGEGPDPRLEWCDLIEPGPDVVPTAGLDSGDAISQHAASFAEALNRWITHAELTSR